MRVLVTGGSGTLGYTLSALAVKQWDTIATYFSNPNTGCDNRRQVDLRNRADFSNIVESFKPDVIIHTATSDRSVDMADTIVNSARTVAEVALGVSCRLITLSTDVIFDGTEAPYSEEAHPSPVHAYGKAKVAAEEIILQTMSEALNVRTSLIYDFDRRNRQLGWMIDSLDRGETISLFVDEFRQPIWVRNLAEALLELATTSLSGVLNVVGGQVMN